jgi:hypothetical protein
MMKRFIGAVRWMAVVGLLVAVARIAASYGDGPSCVVIFAITAGAVIGSKLIAPRRKMEVALLMFGMGMTLSVTLFTVTPDRLFTAAPSLLRLSVYWKDSACGIIGSVIGFLVARKSQP